MNSIVEAIGISRGYLLQYSEGSEEFLRCLVVLNALQRALHKITGHFHPLPNGQFRTWDTAVKRWNYFKTTQEIEQNDLA